jgi:hypothetical protein
MTWPPENTSFTSLLLRMLTWRFVFVVLGIFLIFVGVFEKNSDAGATGGLFLMIGGGIYLFDSM